MSDKDKIRDTAEIVEGIVKAVPIYEDALQPAAKEIGTALLTVAKAINVALAPISALVWSDDQIRDYILESLTEKLKDVPEEQIVTPDPTVAGPTLEALRFAGHEPSLRELYANLLATSMDAKTAKEAHPAFVEIISQMTPDEARIVKLFAAPRAYPVITIRAEMKEGKGEGGVDVLAHFSLLGYEAGCLHPELTASYLDNLCRLGLAEIPPLFTYTTHSIYEPLENHPQVLGLIAEIEKSENRNPNIIREGLKVTTLGRQFCEACVVERDRR